MTWAQVVVYWTKEPDAGHAAKVTPGEVARFAADAKERKERGLRYVLGVIRG